MDNVPILQGHFTPSGMDGNMNSEGFDSDLNGFFDNLTPGLLGMDGMDAIFPFQAGLTPEEGHMFDEGHMQYFPAHGAMPTVLNSDQCQSNLWPADHHQPVDPNVTMGFHINDGVPPANSFQGVSNNQDLRGEHASPLLNDGGQPNVEQPPAPRPNTKRPFEDGEEEKPAERPKKRRQSKKEPLSEEQVEDKRGKFLSRNRQAAKKCRMKKAEWIQMLQNSQQALSRENSQKKAELSALRAELDGIFGYIRQHHANGCPTFNNPLGEYEARKMAEAAGQHSGRHHDNPTAMGLKDFQESVAMGSFMSAPMSRGNSMNSLGSASLHSGPASMDSPGCFAQPMSRDSSMSSAINAPYSIYELDNIPLEGLYAIANDATLELSNKELRKLKERIKGKEDEQRQAMRQHAAFSMANGQTVDQRTGCEEGGPMCRQNSAQSDQYDSGFSSMGTPENLKDSSSHAGRASTTPSAPRPTYGATHIGHGVMKGDPSLPAPVGLPVLDQRPVLEHW